MMCFVSVVIILYVLQHTNEQNMQEQNMEKFLLRHWCDQTCWMANSERFFFFLLFSLQQKDHHDMSSPTVLCKVVQWWCVDVGWSAVNQWWPSIPIPHLSRNSELYLVWYWYGTWYSRRLIFHPQAVTRSAGNDMLLETWDRTLTRRVLRQLISWIDCAVIWYLGWLICKAQGEIFPIYEKDGC